MFADKPGNDSKERGKEVPKRVYSTNQNNKGLSCPFAKIVGRPWNGLCQEGYCSECRIFLNYSYQPEGHTKNSEVEGDVNSLFRDALLP